MPRPFSAGAEKLAAMSGQILGWTPDQFWQSTPAELATIFTALSGDANGSQRPVNAQQLNKLKDKFPDG